MATIMEKHLANTLELRQNPNLDPVQKRKLTKRLKNQVRCVYGYEALDNLETVMKMVKANKWTLTPNLLAKLLAFAAVQNGQTALDTEPV